MGNVNKKLPIIIIIIVGLSLLLTIKPHFFNDMNKENSIKKQEISKSLEKMIANSWGNSNEPKTIYTFTEDSMVITNDIGDKQIYKLESQISETDFTFSKYETKCTVSLKNNEEIILYFSTNIKNNGGLSVPQILTIQ